MPDPKVISLPKALKRVIGCKGNMRIMALAAKSGTKRKGTPPAIVYFDVASRSV